MHKSLALFFTLALMIAGCVTSPTTEAAGAREAANSQSASETYPVQKTEAEWRESLSPKQFKVLRESGTEMAFTGEYYKTKTPGVYLCAGCNAELFSSEHKFDSGTGWPSFYTAANGENVETETDSTLGMSRTEIKCAQCGGHLGHVFNDGPKPTGLRYCVNSASLVLAPAE